MSVFRLPVHAFGVTSFRFHFRVVERGYIQGIATTMHEKGIPYPDVYVVIGMMSGGQGDAFISTVFYSGYISQNKMYLWTGNYRVEAYDTFFVKTKSFTSTDFVVAGSVVSGDC